MDGLKTTFLLFAKAYFQGLRYMVSGLRYMSPKLLLMEEILLQGRPVLYPMIYGRFYTSHVVVWDFWTINSIRSDDHPTYSKGPSWVVNEIWPHPTWPYLW